MARSALSSTGRSRRPRSWSRVTGCGRCAPWTRPSSGSSGLRTTAEPSRSARSSSTRGCDGARAITRAASTETHRAIETIWRIESARLVAGLARLVGDFAPAEELAQDALVAALEQWPVSGGPEEPGAWPGGTAKQHATELIRPRPG